MGPWKSRVGGFAFEIEKLDEGMSGWNAGGGSELVAVWMEGESKNTAGKGVGFLVTAPLVLEVPGGGGGEGEDGFVGKMSEKSGVVRKRKRGGCLRGCEGVQILSGIRVPKTKREGITGGGKGVSIRRESESLYG